MESKIECSVQSLTSSVAHLRNIPTLGILVSAEHEQSNDAFILKRIPRVERIPIQGVYFAAQCLSWLSIRVDQFRLNFDALVRGLSESLRLLSSEVDRFGSAWICVFWVWDEGEQGGDGKAEWS
jgi:hypothetical protein